MKQEISVFGIKRFKLKKDYRLSYAFANMAMGTSIALVIFTLNPMYSLLFVAGFMVAYQDYHKLTTAVV